MGDVLKGDGSSKDDNLVSRQEPATMGEQEPFLICSMIGAEFGWVKLGNKSRVCCVCNGYFVGDRAYVRTCSWESM